MAAEVQRLEERVVLSPGLLAIGVGEGNFPRVGVFDSTNGLPLYEFNPYPDFPGFRGGIRTAAGFVRDFQGNPGFPVVITALGPGLAIPSPVRVFAGVAGTLSTGQSVGPGQLIGIANPFPGFSGGINLGASDFDLDGFTDIIAGAGEGGGPHVKIISTFNFSILFNRFVYDPNFRGGVRVAGGKINPGDAFPELITGAGPGGGPHVKVFAGTSGAEVGGFFAYNPAFTGGVYVAAGDFDGNGIAEIVTGAGPGGGPHVRIIPVFGPNPNDPQFDFNRFTTSFPYSPSYSGGVRVAAAYINSDAIADLIVARGPGGIADTIVFSGASANVIYSGPSFVNPFVTTGSFPSSTKFVFEALRLDEEVARPTENAPIITTRDVQPLFDAALTRLQGAGIPQETIEQLRTLEIQVTNLGGNVLGIARANQIVLDDDAAGIGYFIDSTPYDDEEFDGNGLALETEAQRVDLLTVVLHELGHHLGLDDLDPATHSHDVMAGTFLPGERRLLNHSAVDSLFSRDDLFDRLLAPSLF